MRPGVKDAPVGQLELSSAEEQAHDGSLGRSRPPSTLRAGRLCPFFAADARPHSSNRGVNPRRTENVGTGGAVDDRIHREVRHGGKISGRSSQESRWDDPCAFRNSVLDARCSSATVTIARQSVAFARPRPKAVPRGHSRWSISRRRYHPPPCSPASSEAHYVVAPLRTGCLRLTVRCDTRLCCTRVVVVAIAGIVEHLDILICPSRLAGIHRPLGFP
jgi:hypothetical protein